MLKRASLAQRSGAGVTAVMVVVAQLALPPHAEASHLGSTVASAGSAPPPAATLIESFQADMLTGRATTSIPIVVPPGRRGLVPTLALSYASSSRNGWLGVGWDLDVGYVERSTKNGVPKYDSSDTFMLQVRGVHIELVKIPDGTYRAKDEGLFVRVENKGPNGWEVRDKVGRRLLFGGTPESEQTTLSGTFRWCLRKVLDTNGNFLVQVGTDPELLPRQRITSVPLAIRAEVAEGLVTQITTSTITDDANKLVPAGAIILSDGASCPAGYTRLTSYDDRFLVGSSTAGTMGGSNMHDHAGSSGNHALTISEIPSHAHGIRGHQNAGGEGPNFFVNTGDGVGVNTEPAGGGSGHSHTISSADNRPAFKTILLCKKN